MLSTARFSFSIVLPFEALDSVANERPVQKRAELFRCQQPGSLSRTPGGKNHRHREVHAATSRLLVALPGRAGWETPGMSGPVRVTVIVLHVVLINLHQLVDVGVVGSRQIILKHCLSPVNGRGRDIAETWMMLWETTRSSYYS